MSIPLHLQNLNVSKRSPILKHKAVRPNVGYDAVSPFFNQISHKLYYIKNLDLKKKIVILDEFSIQNIKEGSKEDIDGAITSRYEPIETASRDIGLTRCKKMVIGQNKSQNNVKISKNQSPGRCSKKRRGSFQQSAKKR